MRALSMLVTVLAAVTFIATGTMADQRYGKQKVVYHVNYTGGDKDKK